MAEDVYYVKANAAGQKWLVVSTGEVADPQPTNVTFDSVVHRWRTPSGLFTGAPTAPVPSVPLSAPAPSVPIAAAAIISPPVPTPAPAAPAPTPTPAPAIAPAPAAATPTGGPAVAHAPHTPAGGGHGPAASHTPAPSAMSRFIGFMGKWLKRIAWAIGIIIVLIIVVWITYNVATNNAKQCAVGQTGTYPECKAAITDTGPAHVSEQPTATEAATAAEEAKKATEAEAAAKAAQAAEDAKKAADALAATEAATAAEEAAKAADLPKDQEPQADIPAAAEAAPAAEEAKKDEVADAADPAPAAGLPETIELTISDSTMEKVKSILDDLDAKPVEDAPTRPDVSKVAGQPDSPESRTVEINEMCISMSEDMKYVLANDFSFQWYAYTLMLDCGRYKTALIEAPAEETLAESDVALGCPEGSMPFLDAATNMSICIYPNQEN